VAATKHSTYQSIDITVDVDGEFRAIVDGKALRSGSLKSLKTAIDTRLRSISRLSASGLKAIVLVQNGRSRWGDSKRGRDDWFVGTFDGIDAHTGDCYIKAEDGTRHEVSYGFWFRADDVDGVAEVKRVLTAHRAAEVVEDKLKDELVQALGRHGCQVTMIHGHDKSKHAVEVEQKMVEFLGNNQKQNAPLDSRAIGDNELIRGEP